MVLHAPRTGQNVKYDPIDSMPFQLRAGLGTCPTPRPGSSGTAPYAA